jgi:hypothetical protein
VIDQDVLDVLYMGAHMAPGALPKLPAEVHWRPYLLNGPLPEDMLAHRAFDRYRVPVTAAADEMSFERTPCAEAQARYLRTRALRHRGALLVPREAVYAALQPVVPAPPPGACERLRVFAQNYEGTALGHATLYHKHSPAARMRYLFMELCLLHALLAHLWSPDCAAEVARRAAESDAALCALADGIGVVLHADLNYIARPAALADYNARVLEAARLPCALAARLAPVLGSGLSAAREAALLSGTHDGDVERFRGEFVGLVRGASPP